MMRYALNTPNFGEFADPKEMAALAREAEDAGWDGYFIWDHVFWKSPNNQPASDPWTLLALMAAATDRLLIGPLITPLPRRRPHTLARQTVTLDRYSDGRVVLGVGIGGDWFGDYSTFGETDDQKEHGTMLDEALEVLTRAWTGEEFSYIGAHYTVKDGQFLPTPIQQPRIPIWVASGWPGTKPVRRAAQWDGIFPLRKDDETMQPDDYRAMLDYVREYRTAEGPFEVLHAGNTPGDNMEEARALVCSYEEAGVTMWLESFWSNSTVAETRARIKQGPPRLD
jgi:alkanesulfonate monooxygenase SsuD/methylene tetrahydromethanopterin reductase-like flavin-dependent oxidoreductase (luciferase family)